MKGQEENQFLFEVLEKFQDEIKRKKLLRKAQGLYLMHSFKIKFMTRNEANDFYSRFSKKYKSGEFTILPNQWYKNERRLFLWYLVCFCEHQNVSIQNLNLDQWTEMGKMFFNKSPLFLKFQGLTIYKNIKRHNWNDDQDKLLEKYVKEIGTNQWNEVSKLLFFHNDKGNFISSKQCRERWFNHICKQTNKTEWSLEEDIQVLKLSKEMGKKWSAIARQLKTRRTQHMVKNRYVSILNKIRSNKKQSQQFLVNKAIRSLQQAKDGTNQKEQQSLQVNHSEHQSKISEEKNIPNQNKTNPNLIVNQAPEVEIDLIRQQFSQSLFFPAQGQTFDKQIAKFLMYSDEGGPKQSMESGHISITPSTVKPISVSPFTFFNNFDNCAYQFQKKRKDGSTLFSPYPSTPIPSLGPSPFVGYRSTSLCSPVAVSELPFCDPRDRIDRILKNNAKDSEEGI